MNDPYPTVCQSQPGFIRVRNLLHLTRALLSFSNQFPADHFELPLQYQIDGFAIGLMLQLEYASRERMLVVGVNHRDRPLHDDRPVVEFLIDIMYCAPGNFHPVGKRLLLRFQSGECGQERWVNVEDPLRKLPDKPWGQ